MRNTLKLTKAILVLFVLTIFSCSSDDDNSVAQTVINLEDLTTAIDENPTVGQSLGTIQSNVTSALTYSISAQNPTGALSIDASTGELTVLDATLFDFEVNPTITATIAATGVVNTATVMISLNDLPDVLVNYTVTIQSNATAGQDAFLGSSVPDNNYGTHPDFMSNKFSAGIVRSLIRFDFSSIPTNAIVNNVAASFYSYVSPGNGNHFIGRGESYLQKLDSAWDEATVTWNNQPTSSTTDQVMLDNAQSNIQDYLDLDITATATNMINNPAENYGYVLKLIDETTSNNKLIFGSSDNQDASLHPKVVVQYSVYE